MIWTLSIDKQGWESGGYRVRRHPKNARHWVAAYQPYINLVHVDGFCRKTIPGPHLSSRAAKSACEKHHKEFIRTQQENSYEY